MKTAPSELIPAELVPAIEKAAEEERRSPQELVGEALERYLSERRYFRADDVHRQIAKGLESLRQGRGLDGEAVMTELLAELEP